MSLEVTRRSAAHLRVVVGHKTMNTRIAISFLLAVMTFSSAADNTSMNEPYAGVGIVVAKLDDDAGYIRVMKVAKDSPADKADIHSFDLIISISGNNTKDMTLGDAVSMLKGPQGEAVHLQILSKTNNTQREVILFRQLYETPSTTKWKYEVLSTLQHPGTTNKYFTIEEREEDVQSGPRD